MNARLCAAAICVALAAVVVGAQTATVRIVGPQTLALSATDLAGMPRTTVHVSARGQDTTYEGVSMRMLLTKIGVPEGEALRGRELAQAVLISGADGYQVAFGIAEFDPAFTDRVTILADRRDGATLTGNEAPFQLVMTGEKRPARWVRQVQSIEVRAVVR